MLQQINAAHDQMRVFYALGRQRLQEQGRLNEDHAAKFARIDERLFSLQRDPLQLEYLPKLDRCFPNAVLHVVLMPQLAGY
ncbi:unnamed protein product [Symbiodinium natans]|uniref:Uncharacterized protein n=1 Tax=Symbiodinium natans TaxID=878477 RepID=A0A812QC56_9DINO|nr:unnamed protein product [Symbiodinium natans]